MMGHSPRDSSSRVVLKNLALYKTVQPWVDAAFKKRGIDPGELWR